MRRTQIVGTGVDLPAARLASSDWDAKHNMPDGWLADTCGVETRHVAFGEAETQEKMAVRAAQNALENAKMAACDIDLILFSAAVGRQPIPATAPLIKGLLGITKPDVAAFDVNATCLSTLVAMDLADMYIRSERAQRVLIVSSEIASRGLPWADDPATAGLFGDGAGAVILADAESSDQLQLIEFAMETWPEGYEYCQLGAGGTRFDFANQPNEFSQHSVFRMDGHQLFKLSRTRLPEFVDNLLGKSGWQAKDVDLVVPHQASPLALEHMVRRCGFAPERVVNTVRKTGNLIAASLPITLDTARKSGRISAGSKVLMIGTSAGVSVAGMTLVG